MKIMVFLAFALTMPGFAADRGVRPAALEAFSDNISNGVYVSPAGMPSKMAVPHQPRYVEQPVVSHTPNEGRYRPYIPVLDKVKAVLLAPHDHDRENSRPYGYMETSEIMEAINRTAAELSKINVRVIMVGGAGTDMDRSVEAVKAHGANMDYVETFYKSASYLNHMWFRDYGLLPIKDLQTGKWSNVSLVIRGKPLGDLLKLADKRFGMPTIDSLDVTETGGQLRGGNIMVDAAGRCFSAGFKHPLFESTLKCNKTVTFPCRSSVCHVDEYVTFLKNNTVVTNKTEFVPALKEAGYVNIRLVPDDEHLSLANVLIVNDVVFMMYLDAVKDKMLAAKAVFEGEGYKVVTINSGGAGRQYGAIHCLTKEIPE